jgi:hypothetical protein
LLLLGSETLGLSGCTRHFFRNRADKEALEVIAEKDQYEQSSVENFYVYPHEKARFADGSNPDRPPMPPDDPATQSLSPCPQKPGKAGTALIEGTGYLDLLREWDAENRAAHAKDAPMPSPATVGDQARDDTGKTATLLDVPSDKSHPFLLNLAQASELGLINSRDFQDKREDLYLVALPVTLQRFAFAAQFFMAEEAIRAWSGKETVEGSHNRWSFTTGTGFAKLFSTGALLLLDFANQTVVELTGFPRKLTSVSTINLDLIQPFLRGGGRAVTLEPLTQAERNLVYQIRTYARFRKEFFVSVAGGGSLSGGAFVPSGAISTNVVVPGAGLGGSSIVPGVIPPPGLTASLQVTPGPSGRLILNPAIPAPVSGYLGTCLQFAQIALDEGNIRNLQYFLKLFDGIKEGGDIGQLQVDTVEQQLLAGRNMLLSDQQQYYDAIDRFKLQLGVPLDVQIELDDSPLRPINQQFERYDLLFRQFSFASREGAKLERLEIGPKVRAELRRLLTTSDVTKGTRFQSEILPRWSVWEKRTEKEMKDRLTQLAEERRKLLDEKAKLSLEGKDLSEADLKKLDDVQYDLELGSFESTLRDYEAMPWKNIVDPVRRQKEQRIAFLFLADRFIIVLGEARNERLVQLRSSWPPLPALCVDGKNLLQVDVEEAQAAVTQAALANRLDLMNVRAQLVDAWRQIAVFANSLLGAFNVQYHMDVSSPAGRAIPLAFSSNRMHNQLLLNTELPLVRKAERNNYRASLIAYQRQRRALMEAEDLVVQGVRGEVRTLRVLSENYKIQQRLVELSYLTVDSSLEIFLAPPPPAPAAPAGQSAAGGGGSNAGTAASLTTQLLNAQRLLPQSQNQILTYWITYLNSRLQLYRDMELMPLDYRGVWIDEVATHECLPNGRSGTGGCECPGPGTERGAGAGAASRLPEWPVEPRPNAPAAGTQGGQGH